MKCNWQHKISVALLCTFQQRKKWFAAYRMRSISYLIFKKNCYPLIRLIRPLSLFDVTNRLRICLREWRDQGRQIERDRENERGGGRTWKNTPNKRLIGQAQIDKPPVKAQFRNSGNNNDKKKERMTRLVYGWLPYALVPNSPHLNNVFYKII